MTVWQEQFTEAVEAAILVASKTEEIQKRFPEARPSDAMMVAHVIIRHGYPSGTWDVEEALSRMDLLRASHDLATHTGHKHG